MKTIKRLIHIVHTLGRHHLGRLFTNTGVSKKFALLLLLFKLYPQSPHTRGKDLRLALEELGPIFVKFGQLLSTRPDLLPADIIAELNHLQDNVRPFAPTVFRQLVEDALGDSVTQLFQSFDPQPLASASVAQVHAARLHSGEEVIIKVIRPGIEATIEQDLQLLLAFAQLIEKVSADGRRLRPVDVVQDYRNTIFDELDLAIEAANASQLRRHFEHSHSLYIPQVFWPYCKPNILVMERIDGIPVTDLQQLRAQNTNLQLLAERGVEIFFTQVFEHNFFHADMHPGNIFVSRQQPEQPSYMAVDMAIMGSLSREDQYYLARNLLAMFRRDYRQVAELHVLSGWVPANTSIGGFEAAIRAVCEPVFEKPLKDISFGEALMTLFKTARRFNMPVQPQLVLLQKTLLNIEGLGRQLYPDLNLWDTAHPYLERWIKQRFQPNSLWQDLRYHAPEWLEKMPELPQLIYNKLKDSPSTSATIPAPRSDQAAKPKQQVRRYAVAAIAVLMALSLSSASLPQLEDHSVLLILLAIFALIL